MKMNDDCKPCVEKERIRKAKAMNSNRNKSSGSTAAPSSYSDELKRMASARMKK